MLRVRRRGQSQAATYTEGFQDFIVWALMPRPKLKSRGATTTGRATFARGITVIYIFKRERLNLSAFLGTEDIAVHIVHISRLIITYTLE